MLDQVMTSWHAQNGAALVRDGYHKILQAFRALDPEQAGFIEAEALADLMTKAGQDALSAEEVGDMLR